ncbi:ROK family protein [Candidatus Daviesbacteria bacterium]|nr:ROK family protein [Candidatus Daviesbacteria bacterium]
MYLLFDIGGTNTKLAVSEDGFDISDKRIYQTPEDYNLGLKLMKDTFELMTRGAMVAGVAGGIAGPLSPDASKIVKFTNNQGWNNQEFKSHLQEAFHAPVFIGNDAAMGGLGEASHGGGVGFKVVSFITVSTGFGGSRIENGKIDISRSGLEIGHQIIETKDSVECSCGGTNHLESFLSGAALERKYGKSAKEIDDPEVWDEMARLLSIGLFNTTVYWLPDVIVLGGSLMKSINLEKVRIYFETKNSLLPSLPEIKLSKLGDLAGVYGSLEFLKQNLGGNQDLLTREL